ncbi:MAG: hypothetical protein NTX50_02660 [Candidatus Sumerlaeota bacterium]|nr:hypothetical protein [Candidatus Sumerlaeota bacterium]
MQEQSVFEGNPFAIESPERLTASQILALFVEEYTRVAEARQKKHTFIWGPRGSGKSMMLRYMEIRCVKEKIISIEDFLSSADGFFGVYCPCKEGQFNKTELVEVLPERLATLFTEHLLNLSLVTNLIIAIRKELNPEHTHKDKVTRFGQLLVRLFDPGAIAPSRLSVNGLFSFEDEPLEWIIELLNEENRRVTRFLRATAHGASPATYSGSTTGYHDFLLPAVRLVQKEFLGESVPIFFLLDDVDRLRESQCSIVNTWVANRDQQHLCFKITANRDLYATFSTRDGGFIEQPHDYSEIDVEELYTSSSSDFQKRMMLIANRRLQLSLLPTKDIDKFLPSSVNEQKLLAEIRIRLEKEWDEKQGPGRKRDYVYRYAIPRLFQQLGKQKKSYAGFGNIVDLSSGIVRDFLEPVYLMVDHTLNQGAELNKIEFIPVGLQDDILHRYSEEFLLEKFAAIRKGLPPEKHGVLDRLAILVESLGQLFYVRLHDPDAREGRVFSFTLRGIASPELKRVLDLGVSFRYFQLRTYSRKEGGGLEKWYVLNRRVCPKFKLDASGFGGRISLTPEMAELACRESNEFVRLRLGEPLDYEEPDLFTMVKEGISWD